MKNSFVNNSEDVFSANEAQMKKIEFLTRQKTKTDMYIKDLEESLKLNKEAVKALNKDGPNNRTIHILNQQNSYLHKKLQQCYQENRDTNALRLFQAQIRIQDRSFYNERILQFENRISDLRKYLHDKEDSFTNVVNRLRKYEDINELTIQQKLSEFKNEFSQNINTDLLAALSRQRNMYKKMYLDAQPHLKKIQVLDLALRTNMNMDSLRKKIEKIENQIISKKNNFEIENSMPMSNKKSNLQENPNKELIRLLKKEKLSNQILEEALNDAIEKNEELINHNERLMQANNQLEQTCNDLRSQILVLQDYLAEYQENYKRKNFNLNSKCDLSKPSYKYSDFSNDVTRKGLIRKLKQDMERISSFMASTKNKMMVKSCSGPRLACKTCIDEDDDIQITEV